MRRARVKVKTRAQIDPRAVSCHRSFLRIGEEIGMQGLMMHRPLGIIDILTHAAEVTAGQGLVIMTDRAHMPETALDTLCYEDLPLTATGKVSKLTLHDGFADCIHPDLRRADT